MAASSRAGLAGRLAASVLLLCVCARAATELSVLGTSSSPAPVRFLVMGDWGRNGTYNQSLVAEQMGKAAQAVGAQFVISTGDNFYEEGLSSVEAEMFEQSFSRIYSHEALQLPFYAVLGNHDYYGNALAQLDPALVKRDSRWNCWRSHKFTRSLDSRIPKEVLQLYQKEMAGETTDELEMFVADGNEVEFFMYDTTPLVTKYRTENKHSMDWRGINSKGWDMYIADVLGELNLWLSTSTARWKIVIGHHPVYSFGSHGNQEEMIRFVKPLFELFDVDLYINGHDHNLQHIKRDDSNIHYVTSGGGSKAYRGDTMDGVNTGLKFYWPGQGFNVIQVDYSTLKIDYVDVFGKVIYSFSLTK
eukprot:TRINITY_DN267_c0_g1_i3.p1 TRINITY_DN267_c0_g1~~TRINITY_DN267_c0_g1_i3.p1  ORF type:complete len:360 (-),score=56.60 TRINITY_DN267_c0_g1_i3:182-1261(-)